MALTREYRETVVERLRADREFTAAVFAEAISAFVEGDKATTLSILRKRFGSNRCLPLNDRSGRCISGRKRDEIIQVGAS